MNDTNVGYSGNTANENSLTNNFYSKGEDSYSDTDASLNFDITQQLYDIKNNYDMIYPETDKYPFISNIEICYVRENNPNSNKNGSSWDTAFVKVQACIDYLYTISPNDGGEVWVAKGTYLPNKVPDWRKAIGDTHNKYKSITLRANIRLYGGFNGTETDRNQRDFYKNPTYLSCQLTNSLQCYQIIHAADNTTVDGFIFKDAGKGPITTRRRLANSISIEYVLASTSSFLGSGIWSNSTNIIVANSIFLQLFAKKGKSVLFFLFCLCKNLDIFGMMFRCCCILYWIGR